MAGIAVADTPRDFPRFGILGIAVENSESLTGLPRTVVRGLQILPRYRKLVAATFGRGIYQIPLSRR